jgi:hypothetical protein
LGVVLLLYDSLLADRRAPAQSGGRG